MLGPTLLFFTMQKAPLLRKIYNESESLTKISLDNAYKKVPEKIKKKNDKLKKKKNYFKEDPFEV